MTVEEFLAHCDLVRHHQDKGKARLNRARRAYAVYILAYKEKSLYGLITLARLYRGSEDQAVSQAAKDRDAGRPICFVPELMGDQ
jgi:hypothetical protein